MKEISSDSAGDAPKADANEAVSPEEAPPTPQAPAAATDDVVSEEADSTEDAIAFSEVGPPVMKVDGIPAETIAADIAPPEVQSKPRAADWENELSPQRVAIELRRIEADIRAIIDSRDSIRKRRLTGSHRWLELEEDILAWQYSGRFDQAALQRVRELIVQRHHLFNHLRYLASTRPTWNS